MQIDKYILRRIQRWWSLIVTRHIYKDLPFSIIYTDIADKYNYPKGEKLAEFDFGNQHYYLYTPIKELL